MANTATSAPESKSFYIDASDRRARLVRRKIVYGLTLLAVCVVLGVVIALVLSLGIAVAMQTLWDAVRG